MTPDTRTTENPELQAVMEVGCPHGAWGITYPCPHCGTPRSLSPSQHVSDRFLREVERGEREWPAEAAQGAAPRIVADAFPSQIVGGEQKYGAHIEAAAPRAEGLDVDALIRDWQAEADALRGSSGDVRMRQARVAGVEWCIAYLQRRLAPQERQPRECVNCGVTDGHSEACVHHPDVQERLRESRG